jgi:hypothetical protein
VLCFNPASFPERQNTKTIKMLLPEKYNEKFNVSSEGPSSGS